MRAKDTWPLAWEPRLNEREEHLSRIESAWGRCAYSLRTGDRVGHRGERMGPSLISAHGALEVRKREFEQGDTLSLLLAVDECAQQNLPLPEWLASAFHDALRRFVGISPRPENPAQSLDEVFASPSMPAGGNKAARARQEWELGTALWGKVRAIAKDHTGLDPAIREVLNGAKWGVKPTKAKELVAMIDESQSRLTAGAIKPLSQIWRKPRKRVTRT